MFVVRKLFAEIEDTVSDALFDVSPTVGVRAAGWSQSARAKL